MKYRRAGTSGLKVSTIALGSYLTIGHRVPDVVARELVARALDNGVNFFDTANAYNRGGAETTLGRLLANTARDRVVLATKVWAPMGDGPNDRGLSRKHIFDQCHGSLRRLHTEYIDIYQCHRFDPETPVEETVRALDDLIRRGDIRYWGVSEWTPEQQHEALVICERRGLHRPISNQPRYSLLWRHPERAVFPFGVAEGIGQFVFSPLAHGVLSGKYVANAPAASGTRAATEGDNAIMLDLYLTPETLGRVQALVELSVERGMTPSQLAIAWILRNPAVTSVIAGATRPEQLEDNLGAADIDLDADAAHRLEALFPAPSEVPDAP